MSIAASRITKRFDDFVALDDVSVDVAPLREGVRGA